MRQAFAYREPTPALFGQTVLLWLVFAALALVPARAVDALLRRGVEPRRGVPAYLHLLAWAVFPVLAHRVLDRYTGINADTSALRSPTPWLAVGGVALGLTLLVVLGGRLTSSWRAGRAAAGLGALVLAAAALLSTVSLGETRERPAAPDGAPNILLLVWDTTRSPSLNVYGYERDTTSWLERFAEQATTFENARSASTFTFTSHLSMFTGVYPSHHGARLTRQSYDPVRTPTVADLLRKHGYRTGGFVGTAVLSARTGIDVGFDAYDDLVDPPVADTHAWALVHDVQAVLAKTFDALRFDGLPHWFQDFQRPAGDVLASAERWIREGGDEPWFCMVNMYDVHWPFVPPAEAAAKWVRPYDGPMDGYLFRSDDYVKGYAPDARDDRYLLDLYDAEMWKLDRDVEAFLAKLDLSRTGVVVTSDHGEAFGEGGEYGHDGILEPQLRIPLLVRAPARPDLAGARRPDPVSGVDVAATILALAGADRPEHLLGRDLLDQPFPAERRVLVEDRDHFDETDVRLALYRDTWKLVRLGPDDGELRYELFDLTTDAVGLVDVAAEHPELVQELAGDLETLRAAWGPEEGGASGGQINTDALQALGYIGDEP